MNECIQEGVASPIERQDALKRVADVTKCSLEDVEKMYGEHLLSPACVSVGKKMRALREERGVTLECLASQIGCEECFLTITEEGLIPPTGKISLGFADFFGVPWHQIFEEVKDIKVSAA